MTDQNAAATATAEGGETDPLDALDAALGADEQAAGEGGEPQEWKAPTEEEWKAQQAAYEAAQAKLKRARTQAQSLREKAKGVPTTAGAEGDAATEGAAAVPDPQLAVWQGRAVRAAAKVQLLERGADPDLLDLALARLRPDEIDFNKDDEPELEDWLDELEEKHPKLFAKPAAAAESGRRALGGVNQGRAANGAGTSKPKRYGELVIENARRAQRGGR